MSIQEGIDSFTVEDDMPFVSIEDTPTMTRGAFCLPHHTAAAGYLRSLGGEGRLNNVEVPFFERINGEESEDARPFLTVVIRTQGKRTEELTDVLLCLAGQQDDDFEILVIGHRVAPEHEAELKRLLGSFPTSLTRRMRYASLAYGSRTTPLRVGFAAAKGHYVVVLDDDDLVMDTWTSSFKQLAQRADGKMLHTYVVTQKWGARPMAAPNHRELYAEDGFGDEYCRAFNISSQMSVNSCPLMGLAFPRFIFERLGLDFDESLTTTEDWDFLMRAYSICGVASGNNVTSIYRLWTNADCSHTMHDAREWDRNYKKIISKMNRHPYLLDVGGVENVRAASPQALVSREALVQSALLGLYPPHCDRPDYWRDVTLLRADDDTDADVTCLQASMGDGDWDISFICPKPIMASRLVFSPLQATFKVMGEFQLRLVEASGTETILDFSNCSSHNGYQVDCNHIVYLKESPLVAFDLPHPLELRRVDVSFKLMATVADYYIDQVTLGGCGLKLGRARRWLGRKIRHNG